MKRINAYKKLFAVESTTNLKSLKTKYRNLVKEWHPDKFQEDNPLAKEAEVKSQEIIDAYHFLVSMASETIEAEKETYVKETLESGVSDFKHKGQVLEVTFFDGNTYEYFGVKPPLYQKLINSDKQNRFLKRSIALEFPYRKSKTGQLQD
ncbi:MAG: DnaJ-class molecular chaperone [Luteibaculaceae bacterium]|jgi:DnaJ-class molecular chaperone